MFYFILVSGLFHIILSNFIHERKIFSLIFYWDLNLWDLFSNPQTNLAIHFYNLQMRVDILLYEMMFSLNIYHYYIIYLS